MSKILHFLQIAVDVSGDAVDQCGVCEGERLAGWRSIWASVRRIAGNDRRRANETASRIGGEERLEAARSVETRIVRWVLG